MKDWVIEYLIEKDSKETEYRLSEEYFEKIKRNDFGRNRPGLPDNETIELNLLISKKLIDNLNHQFERESKKISKESQKIFIIRFASVLADLPKDKFDYLCNTRNVFYFYCLPSEIAGVLRTITRNDVKIFPSEELRIAYFTNKIPLEDYWISRCLIVHELIHLITGLGSSQESENCVHQTARDWGFRQETEKAIKWEKERRQNGNNKINFKNQKT